MGGHLRNGEGYFRNLALKVSMNDDASSLPVKPIAIGMLAKIRKAVIYDMLTRLGIGNHAGVNVGVSYLSSQAKILVGKYGMGHDGPLRSSICFQKRLPFV